MQPANETLQVIILHCRPYQDSSLILDAFSENHGRLSLLAKGSRNSRKNNIRSMLQLSSVLEVSLSGRGELKRITQVDEVIPPRNFYGERFAMACYVSELVLRLLQPGDHHPDMYLRLNETFQSLSQEQNPLISLRQFELLLIQELGAQIDFEHTVNNEPLEDNLDYNLYRCEGFCLTQNEPAGKVFKGQVLKQIALDQWTPECLKALKAINRELLSAHLGKAPLRSRELWLQWHKSKIKQPPTGE